MMIVALAICGCDLPDRHDIEFLRRPAVWEVKPEAAEGQIADNKPMKLSSAIDPNSEMGPGREGWRAYFLHQIDQFGLVGGGMIDSETVAAEDGQMTGNNVTAGQVIKVTLREHAVLHPNSPAVLTTQRTSPDETRLPNTVRCFTSNEQTFWHDETGNLTRVVCSVRRGFVQTRKNIVIRDGTIVIDTDSEIGPKTTKIRHEGPLGGPLMVYQSLLGNPMAANEVREASVLLPIHEQLAQLRLRAAPQALARRWTPDGIQAVSLNEAVGLLTVDGSQHRERVYWYDDQGVIQTTNVTGESRFTYRCDAEAFAKVEESLRKERYPIRVDVPGEKIGSGEIVRMAIRVELLAPEVDWNAIDGPRISSAPRQYTQKVDERTQRVLTSMQPIDEKRLAGRFSMMQSTSTAADLAATAIVDYRSAAMNGVLATIGPFRNLPLLERAEQINRTVHSLLSLDELASGVQPASVITKSTTADSTEHAILLTAMLRFSQIPARIAFGLRHLPDGPSSPSSEGPSSAVSSSAVSAGRDESEFNQFVYHAWVIAEVAGEWISLDPTTGERTSPGCFAIETNDLSSLDAESIVDHYLSLLRSMHFRVEKVSVQ